MMKEIKEKQDRNEQENSETDAMNIDMDSLRINNPFIKNKWKCVYFNENLIINSCFLIVFRN